MITRSIFTCVSLLLNYNWWNVSMISFWSPPKQFLSIRNLHIFYLLSLKIEALSKICLIAYILSVTMRAKFGKIIGVISLAYRWYNNPLVSKWFSSVAPTTTNILILLQISSIRVPCESPLQACTDVEIEQSIIRLCSHRIEIDTQPWILLYQLPEFGSNIGSTIASYSE